MAAKISFMFIDLYELEKYLHSLSDLGISLISDIRIARPFKAADLPVAQRWAHKIYRTYERGLLQPEALKFMIEMPLDRSIDDGTWMTREQLHEHEVTIAKVWHGQPPTHFVTPKFLNDYVLSDEEYFADESTCTSDTESEVYDEDLDEEELNALMSDLPDEEPSGFTLEEAMEWASKM